MLLWLLSLCVYCSTGHGFVAFATVSEALSVKSALENRHNYRQIALVAPTVDPPVVTEYVVETPSAPAEVAPVSTSCSGSAIGNMGRSPSVARAPSPTEMPTNIQTSPIFSAATPAQQPQSPCPNVAASPAPCPETTFVKATGPASADPFTPAASPWQNLTSSPQGQLRGSPNTFDVSEGTCAVQVTGLPRGMTEEYIKTLALRFGRVCVSLL